MSELSTVGPAFVTMAHRIVWSTVATVGEDLRPRTRILHPVWNWDGRELVGVLGTWPSRLKRTHLGHSPYVSLTYWSPSQDTCTADCAVEWIMDDAGREEVWRTLADAPAPVGYDPASIPTWVDGPRSPAFAGWRLTPYRLRVMPGTVLLGKGGETLLWEA